MKGGDNMYTSYGYVGLYDGILYATEEEAKDTDVRN